MQDAESDQKPVGVAALDAAAGVGHTTAAVESLVGAELAAAYTYYYTLGCHAALLLPAAAGAVGTGSLPSHHLDLGSHLDGEQHCSQRMQTDRCSMPGGQILHNRVHSTQGTHFQECLHQ